MSENAVVSPLERQYPQSKGMFLPTMLDATGFRNDGYWALAICLPLFVLAAWCLRLAHERRTQPQRHPILKVLASIGEPQELAASIDAELRIGAKKVGKATATSSWILRPTTFGLNICQIERLIWVYKKVTRHYHNFIPTGKTFAALLWDRSGRAVEIDGSQEKIDELLAIVLGRAPWVVAGFDKELEHLSKSNWAAFVSAVDERRLAATKARSAAT